MSFLKVRLTQVQVIYQLSDLLWPENSSSAWTLVEKRSGYLCDVFPTHLISNVTKPRSMLTLLNKVYKFFKLRDTQNFYTQWYEIKGVTILTKLINLKREPCKRYILKLIYLYTLISFVFYGCLVRIELLDPVVLFPLGGLFCMTFMLITLKKELKRANTFLRNSMLVFGWLWLLSAIAIYFISSCLQRYALMDVDLSFSTPLSWATLLVAPMAALSILYWALTWLSYLAGNLIVFGVKRFALHCSSFQKPLDYAFFCIDFGTALLAVLVKYLS